MEFRRMDVLGVPIDLTYLITNEGRNMKVEVTVDDLLGNAGLILSAYNHEGAVFVRVCNDDQPEYYVEVAIEDLQVALRKISAK